MFQFSCRFAFLSTFRLSNRTSKITRILALYQTNAASLTPLSKEDKILIKSLQECKGYNACQFVTEFLNKGWTKNSINRLLVNFGTVDRRPGSGRRRWNWWKRRHSWVAVAESGRQTSEPRNSQRNFTWGGDPSIISFADYSQRSASQAAARKGALNSRPKHTACRRYFRHVVWETIT